MAKSRPDEEDFEEAPRPRAKPRPSSRSEEDEEDRPARRSKPAPRRHHEHEDDEDDRRRRDGAMSGVIPYRNVMALAAYYCAFASLIAILGSIALMMATIGQNPRWILLAMFGGGGLFALLAVIFGIVGLVYVSKHPEAKGTGHAITGLILGGLEILGLIGVVVFGAILFGR